MQVAITEETICTVTKASNMTIWHQARRPHLAGQT